MKEYNSNQSIAEFDDQDLPEGHLGRFTTRLDSALHSDKKILKLQVFSIAASIAIIVAMSLILFFKFSQIHQPPTLLAGVSPEMEETELYYQSKIHDGMQVLEGNKLVDEQVISDLEEIDNSFKFIARDLKKNPRDERIISAVMQIYQLKLDVINGLLIQLK